MSTFQNIQHYSHAHFHPRERQKTHKMMAEDIVIEDTEYISEDDQDFNPSTAADEIDSESSDDQVSRKTTKLSRHVTSGKVDDELDFENSGDEVTIQTAKARQKQKRRKKKKGAKQGDEKNASSSDLDLLDDDGGEGGLIKTRAQRKAEKAERKPLAGTKGATADVDAIWARLMSNPLRPAPGIDEVEKENFAKDEPSNVQNSTQNAGIGGGKLVTVKPTESTAKESQKSTTTNDDTIIIKRTYEFAGEIQVEEKHVHKDSAEARLYLSSRDTSKPMSTDEQFASPSKSLLRRPLKRLSRFEPNPAAEIRNLPPNATLPRVRYPVTNLNATRNGAVTAAATIDAKTRAQKINTVTKSKMDWAGFVDKEGIVDELKEHEKGGKAYLDRMDFLGRVEGRQDAEAKKARGAAAV